MAADQTLSQLIDVQSGHSRVNSCMQLLVHLRQNFSGFSHQFDLSRRFNCYCHYFKLLKSL